MTTLDLQQQHTHHEPGALNRCAAMLYNALARTAGLFSAEVDTARGELILEYDPNTLLESELQAVASSLATDLDSPFQQCINRAGGYACTACADALKLELERRGRLDDFTVHPGRMAVSRTTAPAERARLIRSLAAPPEEVQEKSRWPWDRWDPLHKQAVLTAITALGIAVGWIGGAAGLPQPWPQVAYVVAYLAGGFYGVRKGLAELRHGIINIDLLMVLAAIGAAIIGDWREGAILLFLFSLSNTLQDYALGRSRRAIESLIKLRPEEALVRRGELEMLIKVENLRLGDVVIVKPGERLPIDGVVARGQSSVDQSTITGESVPVDVAPGSPVFEGTLNQSGALDIEVTRLPSESTLARIIQLVENAQEQKAPTQRFLDEFEQKYALGVIIATALAIVIPVLVFNQPFEATFYRAMTLLVVASPCALIISVPAAILSAIANAARRGILFKGGAHLENMAAVKAIAFDKTGTLTRGKPVVTDVIPLGCCSETELLALAASVESRSEHPVAQAMVNAARQQGLSFAPCEDLQAISGRGACATAADGRVYLIGNKELFDGKLELGDDVLAQLDALEMQGRTAMLLAEQTGECVTLFGLIAVADEIRPEARDALQALRAKGVEHIIMLTGDNERVARAIAEQAGVDEFRASLLPEEKVIAVRELQKTYGSVGMVGDGVNDAPALALADVGIAMGAAGTDVALEVADVVLMSDDLEKLAYVRDLSRRANRIIWENITFALGVIVVLVTANFLVGVPLPLGVVAHEGSTLIVVFNGLRLLR
ncbi:MAG: cadmium-translocating P-type ATPase [Zoogloeaceae bacterium]|nr:cadmium-translocating P-type ATPase [Zoogloeaceae bacterium]